MGLRATKPVTRLHYLEVQLEEERAAFHAAQVAEREAREEADGLRAENERLKSFHDVGMYSQLQAAEAELERLRAALSEIADLELEGDASLGDAIVIADEALNPPPA